MAVAPAGQINDPMLLRVPPASIKAVGEYGQMLAKRGVAYNMVVTKVAFDQEAESPKLTFKPVGFLDEAAFGEVREMIESDTVRDILGSSMQAVVGPAVAAPEEDEAPAPVAKPKAAPAPAAEDDEPAPAPKAKAAPKAKPAPVVVADDDIDLDGISFDD